MKVVSRHASLIFAIGATVLGANGAKANLIADGGFESPASTTAGYQSGYDAYNPGQSFGGA